MRMPSVDLAALLSGVKYVLIPIVSLLLQEGRIVRRWFVSPQRRKVLPTTVPSTYDETAADLGRFNFLEYATIVVCWEDSSTFKVMLNIKSACAYGHALALDGYPY